MALEENKALVQRFFTAIEEYCRNDETALKSVVAPSFVDLVLGTEGIQSTVGPVKELFTDLRCIVNDLVAEEDRVVAHFVFEFTHTKHFMGVEPTNKRVSYINVASLRIAHGQIVERTWNIGNSANLLRQIGKPPHS